MVVLFVACSAVPEHMTNVRSEAEFLVTQALVSLGSSNQLRRDESFDLAFSSAQDMLVVVKKDFDLTKCKKVNQGTFHQNAGEKQEACLWSQWG